jgi:hypothetical protein
MATRPQDTKKQLESIAGREIEVEAEQLKFLMWYFVGAYDYTDGYVASQHVVLPGMRCNSAKLLDASGASRTGSDGKRTFRLSEFVCLPQHRLLSEPVNVLATAREAKPRFVTTTHTLVDANDILRSDLEVTVYGWDANGRPAPDLWFHWRCRVHSAVVIL